MYLLKKPFIFCLSLVLLVSGVICSVVPHNEKFSFIYSPHISGFLTPSASAVTLSCITGFGEDSLLFNASVFVGNPSSASLPNVSAESAILIEAETGLVIFEKNASAIMRMASTTKIMTAIIALEAGNTSRIISVPRDATLVTGSSVYLKEGESISICDLIYCMMLESANDAAAAIAISIAGSIEGFADMMNQKAEELGLYSTHFDNPHGLDSDSHYTSAHDLAKLTAYALKNKDFCDIVSTYKKIVPVLETDASRLLINHNKMLRTYDGAIGVKTGYTKQSGRCLVSAAERDGLTLISVTLKAPDDWKDHSEMLDFGFSVCTNEIICEKDGIRIPIPVTNGTDDNIICGNTSELRAILPRHHGQIICKIEADRFLYAPVQAGDKIGTATYFCDGKKLGELTLSALTSSESLSDERNLLEKIFDWIMSLFGR